MLRRFFISLVLLFGLSGAAFAQSATVVLEQSEPPLPKPLVQQRDAGAQPYYLGRYNGLDGWVMVREGQPEFYYATPDGKALVMGFLFDGDGNLITGSQIKGIDTTRKDAILGVVTPQGGTETPDAAKAAVATAATPATPATPAPAATAQTTAQAEQPKTDTPKTGGASEMLFSDVQTAASMTLGSPDKPAFYAFVDSNCQHCQKFLREVEPYVLAGTVSVKLIPVGSSSESAAQGAYALALKDGAKRFLDYAKGNAKALQPPKGIATNSIDNNRKIMSTWHFDVTPIILYRAGGAGNVKIVRGRPLDIAGVVKDLTKAE